MSKIAPKQLWNFQEGVPLKLEFHFCFFFRIVEAIRKILYTNNPPYSDWGTHNAYGFYAARSFHTGGVNTARGDGSVKFVANTIDLQTWREMSRIDATTVEQ